MGKMEVLEIPQIFVSILSTNDESYAAVLNTKKTIQPILENNDMTFFPNYTNHGILHIRKMFEYIEKLIPEETLKNLTEQDIEVLISAVLIHDLGMHISYPGFINLINSEEYNSASVYEDKKWSDLWKEYLKEAHRWSSDKVRDIFGTYIKIDDIPKDELEASQAHRLLIGEFIRRYHHKLAYDIAVVGFPGADTAIQCVCSDDKYRKIIGHIARSHAEDLWKMVLFILEKEYTKTNTMVLNTKPVYLMAILRIADYLDMDKKRAKSIIRETKKILIDMSNREWDRHALIENVQFGYHKDKETVYIEINEPSNSEMFLHAKKFIDGLQKELDITWAVLGWTYSRYNDEMEISIRRVDSNLFAMENKLSFLTVPVKFKINHNILFSLAQPLYGSNPSYGIRELLQNASDACKERYAIDLGEYNPQIFIKIEKFEGKNYFTIIDNGIGMDENVILNYFLMAGSSYKDNMEWKKKFYIHDHKIVVRNGKFGIGVIAAFLLGSKLSVETVPFKKNIVYSFEAELDTKQIDLMHRKRNVEEFGTKIKIELDDNIYTILKGQWEARWENDEYEYYDHEEVVPWYEWYRLNDIDIQFDVPKQWLKREVLFFDDKNDDWKCFRTEEYENISWSYAESYSNYDDELGICDLICNGIIIPDAEWELTYSFPISFVPPALSVTDQDGKLPLTLDRKRLEVPVLPFEKDLMRQIYDEILDKFMEKKNITVFKNKRLEIRNSRLKHSAISKNRDQYEPLFIIYPDEYIFRREGFCFCYDYSLRKLCENEITKIWTKKHRKIKRGALLDLIGNTVIISNRETPFLLSSGFSSLGENEFQKLGGIYEFIAVLIIMPVSDYKMVLQDEKEYDEEEENDEEEDEIQLTELTDKLCENQQWVCLQKKGENFDIDLDELGDMKGIDLIIKYRFRRIGPDKSSDDLFSSLLAERLGGNTFLSY